MLRQKSLKRRKLLGYFALLALALSFTLSVVPPTKALTAITFYGPLDMQTVGYFYNSDYSEAICQVTIGYPTTAVVFNITGSASNTTNVDLTTALYFDFLVIDNSTTPFTTYHHQYWITPSDSTMTEYKVFFDHNDAQYVINFLDMVGRLQTYPYIMATANIGGIVFPIEKRPVDVQNSVNFMLTVGSRYNITYSDGTTIVPYGELAATAITGIQLIIRGVDFPKTSLLLSDFVHAYALRDFLNPTGAITVSYEDTSNNTDNVNVLITNATSGLTVLDLDFPSNNTFVYTWASAVNATNYQVLVNVTHSTFGELIFRQYLLGENSVASSPFDLSFLGSVGFNTAWFLPALLIVFVAGCFSELTSEAAAILTVIVAIILVWMGWLSISSGIVVAALALSIMAAVIASKRRWF